MITYGKYPDVNINGSHICSYIDILEFDNNLTSFLAYEHLKNTIENHGWIIYQPEISYADNINKDSYFIIYEALNCANDTNVYYLHENNPGTLLNPSSPVAIQPIILGGATHTCTPRHMGLRSPSHALTSTPRMEGSCELQIAAIIRYGPPSPAVHTTWLFQQRVQPLPRQSANVDNTRTNPSLSLLSSKRLLRRGWGIIPKCTRPSKVPQNPRVCASALKRLA